jgi:hypothetical protein
MSGAKLNGPADEDDDDPAVVVKLSVGLESLELLFEPDEATLAAGEVMVATSVCSRWDLGRVLALIP